MIRNRNTKRWLNGNISFNRWALKLVQDETLMNAYSKGNALAFEELYRRHKHGLSSFLRRQCSIDSVCEELAHDSWMAVIRGADHYQPRARFKTWLYGIAHNRLIDHWRKQGRRANVLFEELNEALLADPIDIDSSLKIEQLLSCLESLSAEQAEAVLLKIEGFSHAEIAEITKSKQETVKSRLRYAVKHLRLEHGAAS